MSEYFHVEKPFLDQLTALGWTVIDQGHSLIPSDPANSLRSTFREWVLPNVFRNSVRAINVTPDGCAWLTDHQLDDLRDQLLRHPSRTLLEANEEVQRLLFKAQVDVNEVTGEADPVVQLIDFAHPERNVFHAINQFRVDTPGCVKACIIPDIVLFVNGIPLVVVEAKIGDQNTANPIHEAFVQLLRYRNARPETLAAGLREGEPRLFYSNLLLIRTCGEKAEFGTITSGHEHFSQLEGYLAGKPPRAFAAAGCGAGTGAVDSGAAGARHAARRAADVLRLHGYRRRPACEGSVPLPAIPCRSPDCGALAKWENAEERSGVVWHTQGSGKSLTMVFVARMLRASQDLADFKIVLVNDRVDLEEQLSATAKLIGGKVNVIESTSDLREHLGTDASDVNMVMVHKFMERERGAAGIA
jgi:type I restriction enzyme R subunit